jgi:uncharacterized membrane protein YcaP (DUF421 family)
MDSGLWGGWDRLESGIIEAVAMYAYTVVLLRLAGKRTIASATVFDFVSTVAMGTMVGSTIVSSSIALSDGIAGITALVALQWVVAWASSRNERFRSLITNTPRLLFAGSSFLDENLRQERVAREDILAKIRESGQPNLGSVQAVVFETTGQVSIIPSSVPERPAEADGDVMGPVRS